MDINPRSLLLLLGGGKMQGKKNASAKENAAFSEG